MSPKERKRALEARLLSFTATGFDNRPHMSPEARASDRLTIAGESLRAQVAPGGAQ